MSAAAIAVLCRLCGESCGDSPLESEFAGVRETFCCTGCLHVFSILAESGALPEGSARDTDLFRRSRELGLVSVRERDAAAKPAIPGGAPSRDAMFEIAGMWCGSCAWLIERALLREPGVLTAEVRFASDLVKVRFCPQYLPPERLMARIRALGYGVAEFTGTRREQDDAARRDLLLRTGLAFFLWMNVMTLSTVLYVSFFEGVNAAARRYVPFVLMALATPAVFFCAAPILRLGWAGLRERVLRMEVLLSTGVLAAYVYSAVEAFRGGSHYYFDTACAIVTLVLAGKLLERGAKERTNASIATLHRLMPRKARWIDGDRERFVAVEDIPTGALLLVKAGERIPVDGVVEQGASHADESLLTGESAPLEKSPGDPVYGGSLNVSSVLRVRTTRLEKDSRVAQIVAAVERALASRSRIEVTVDRVSRVFIPCVVVLALLTLGGWLLSGAPLAEALSRAISVLVIACPCALGIATPLALSSAVGAATRRGILVNDVGVLETVRKLDILVLDKTGTVTEGDFQMLDVALAGETPGWLAAIVALERNSEHPLAKAAVAYGECRHAPRLDAQDVEVRKGLGIEGLVDARRWFIGNRRMAFLHGASLPDGLEQRVSEWEAAGRTVACFGVEGRVAGAAAFGDRARGEAREMVAVLRSQGIHTMLLSGDSEATTAAIAREVGIEDYRAAMLPEDKAAVISELRASGLLVAMVGDGVNDAPSLAQADLGIAMGSGADLAIHAAPMVLMHPSLDRIPEAITLARRSLRIVRQNLFWAFFYNVAGLSLAISGTLNPILAASAMVLSSVSVIANSMRMERAGSGAA